MLCEVRHKIISAMLNTLGSASPISEIVKHPVPMRLQHPRMREEARVAQLRDLLRKQLDSVGRIAKDD